MKRLIIIAIASSLFASCSYEKKLTRAKRKLANLVQEYPELVQHDTIFKIDTTIVPGIAHDTIFRTQITKDTITIIDKQLTIKYYNDGKTTYLKGKCDTVWAIKEVPVQVNNVNPVKEVIVPPWWAYPALWISIGYTALFILLVVLKRKYS